MEKKEFKSSFASNCEYSDVSVVKFELEKKKKILRSVNLSKLPDKGARLNEQINELEDIFKTLSLEATSDGNVKVKTAKGEQEICENVSQIDKYSRGNTETVFNSESKKLTNIKNAQDKENKPFCGLPDTTKFLSFSDLTSRETLKTENKTDMNSPSFKNWRDSAKEHKALLTDPKPMIEKSVPKSSQQHFSSSKLFSTSEECAKKIHNSLVTYPDETKEESEPENLKSSLMMHQRRGLAWLMWREEQEPHGGILADDMGLGKTLTMISLILKQKEKKNYLSFDEKKNECKGTLIVCPASLIHQWKAEIDKHCEINALKVLVYHGPQRVKDYKIMRHDDVVLTTYNIVLAEYKGLENKIKSPLFTLTWERIILDEAHTIKNNTSQTANAVFFLKSFKKWAVTGTPIHNVFKDIYSLVKFLNFSPFDDLKKFKELTNESSESSEKRRRLLIKTILLRRTKDQVDEWGKPLIVMRNKMTEICYIELSGEERKIYEELNEKITKRFQQYLEKPPKASNSSSLLVSLLRLQQCCNHLSLLEKETEEDISTDITNGLLSLSITEPVEDGNSSESSFSLSLDELETVKLRDISVKSSKIKELFAQLNKISDDSDNKDKSVIVSQWVSMLNIVAHHLEKENIRYYLIAGNTKVEDRQKYVNNFNNKDDTVKIMLLSLKAGGVGLNLAGANHLFLLDLHWNPALEMQACDRIHRIDQKKNVVIHKFICKNTIEEKIKSLQDEKCGIANSALKGTRQNTKGLTLDDFKVLFSRK